MVFIDLLPDPDAAILRPNDVSPDELRRRRQALGLSQTELGRRIDASQNTISRWELGTLTIERPNMLDLALKGLEAEPRRRRRTARPDPPTEGA